MSDKRPHIKPEELAGLIRQYLAGELDDKAMHALERQALNDPFLADAIEGYAAHTPEQTVHQQELASRLSERVAASRGRIRPMYYRWAAAAAILLLMFSAGWFLWEQQRKTPIAGINTNKPAPEAAPVFSEHGDTAPAKTKNEQLAEQIAPAAADHQAAKEQAADQSIAPAPKAPVAAEQPAPAAGKADKKTTDDAANEPVPANKNKTTALPAAAPVKPAPNEERARALLEPVANNRTAPPLTMRRQQNFSLNRPDSQQNSLNEVVVMGYGAQKKQNVTGAATVIRGQALENAPAQNTDSQLQGRVAGVSVQSADANGNEETAYREPAPITGQTAFENYLKTKTINPGNKYNGTVRVSFVVMPDGSLQDFRILRHLNEACDAEAIRVIKEGPAWAPASDRKPAKVKVKVKFTVEKDK